MTAVLSAVAILSSGQGLAGDTRRVELELVLAVDTSISVDAEEYALQVAGLAQAFRDPAVVAAIKETGGDGIAVAVVQWGVGLQQEVAVDWTKVRDGATAAAFAAAIEDSPRHFVGKGTGLTRAIRFAGEQLDSNGFSGRRRVIDVSGDGRNNSGANPSQLRDRLVANGIVINGLAVLDGDLMLGSYFEQHVIGGPASFVMTANTFDDFAVAIRAKLLREISVPMARAPHIPSRGYRGGEVKSAAVIGETGR